jgi:hypothetical protein
MRKVILMFVFMASIFTAVNSAATVNAVPDCDDCPFVN